MQTTKLMCSSANPQITIAIVSQNHSLTVCKKRRVFSSYSFSLKILQSLLVMARIATLLERNASFRWLTPTTIKNSSVIQDSWLQTWIIHQYLAVFFSFYCFKVKIGLLVLPCTGQHSGRGHRSSGMDFAWLMPWKNKGMSGQEEKKIIQWRRRQCFKMMNPVSLLAVGLSLL